MAERSLYHNISRILWAFNISKKEVNGKTIEPLNALVPGWMCIPQPFENAITVRSPKHAEFIEKVWNDASREIKLDEKR